MIKQKKMFQGYTESPKETKWMRCSLGLFFTIEIRKRRSFPSKLIIREGAKEP